MKLKGTLRRQLILNILKKNDSTCFAHLCSILYCLFVLSQFRWGKHQCNSPQTVHGPVHNSRLSQAVLTVSELTALTLKPSYPPLLDNCSVCLCRSLRSCPCLFILDMRIIFSRNVGGHILNYMW